MIELGSDTWGSGPVIGISFAYEKKRLGADMLYRAQVTVDPVTGTRYFGFPIYLKLTIGGTLRETVTLKNASPSRWSSAIVYTSEWYTVANKTTGTTPVVFNVYSGLGSTRSASYSFSMAIDPGASLLTVAAGTLGTEQTLTVTRYDDSFTHTITYKCGSASGTVCTKSSSVSVSFTPPLTLASQNTAGTSVSVTFTIQTYSGSSTVGSASTKTATMTIPASVKPSCSIAVSDPTGYAAIFGGYVQDQSKMAISVTATLAYGSAIKSKKIVADGNTYTADCTTPVIASSSNLTISASVTDGRSRSGSNTATVTVLPYTAPKISSLSVHRCNQDGTENSMGSYAKVTYSFAITSLSNKNAKTITLKYKKSVDSSYSSVALTSAYSASEATYIFAAADDSSYDVVLSVADIFTTIQRSTSVSTATVLMHVRADGTGMAFGKVSEKADAFEFGKPIYDKFGTLVGTGLAAYTGGGASGIDPNTTLEPLCLTSHGNAPQGLGTFYYIHTTFYNDKSASAARAQVAVPYNKNGSMYHRYYASGAWSSWARYMTADEIYPVGSVCIRYDTTSPATLYGGTWSRIEGRFLFGCASSGTVGATGSHTTGSGSSTLPYVNVAVWRRTA